MEPAIASRRPVRVELEIGKDYWWCTCGRSSGQPFCDGSHKGTGFTPRRFTAEASEAWLCQCKRTARPPLCDGSHKHLPA